MTSQPWEKTPDFFRHNHVVYYIWRRKVGEAGYMFNCSIDANQPPSPTAGGYYSIEGLRKTKFGTES